MVAKEKLTQETTYLFFNVVLHYDIPPPTYIAHSHLVPSKEGRDQLPEGYDMRIFRPGPNTHVVLTHHWSLVAGCRHEWRLGRHSRGRGRERFKSLHGGEP